jgi:four helix bundle protein
VKFGEYIATVAGYRELLVWQKAMDLVVMCYEITNLFPKNETYGLAIQIRRAAVSIPSNIAEGAGRGHTREYIHHLYIARGSLAEVETQILLAVRLEYINNERTERFLIASTEIGKMLSGLVSSLERRLT